MSTVVWVLLAIVALPLAWWLLKVSTAFLVPQRLSGIAFLKQEVAKRGIPHSHLPAEFFEESVAWAERVSSLPGMSAVARKAEFVKAIEGLVYTIHLWRTEPSSPMFSQSGPNSYRALFEKYRLRDVA